jgi:glycosyltransferase involved in cell wall biosynthesis
VAELISVIVITFNREDALDAVLRSLSRQTDLQFEIVVADDGSDQSTAARVEQWRKRMPVQLLHVRHDKIGFRLAEIRNRAIRASRGDYCIFLDGDCLVASDYVAVHRRLAEPGWFVTGNRVLLSARLTDRVLSENVEVERWGLAALALQWLKRGVNRLGPLLHLPLGPLRKAHARNLEGARGCNLGVWRADLERVDGFDADFNGWGREDSDLMIRLFHAGVRRKDGRFATDVLHLWHPEADRSALASNEQRLAEAIASNKVRGHRGHCHTADCWRPPAAGSFTALSAIFEDP